MKDSIALLGTGLLCAAGAWAFWHYLGNDASSVFTTVMLVIFAVDNFRLRRRLRERDDATARPTPE